MPDRPGVGWNYLIEMLSSGQIRTPGIILTPFWTALLISPAEGSQYSRGTAAGLVTSYFHRVTVDAVA